MTLAQPVINAVRHVAEGHRRAIAQAYARQGLDAKRSQAWCEYGYAEHLTLDDYRKAWQRNAIARKLTVEITPLPRNTDMLSRAMDVQPHQLMGKVWLRSGAAENYEFMSEVSSFRADGSHKHDDQTDNMIDAINIAIVQPQTTKAPAGVMIPRRLRR